MADLFTVKAPLTIRLSDGTRHVMAEWFPLEREPGLIYFELYWHLQRPAARAIHRIGGAVHGDGPWKIADNVITVLGCQGTAADLANSYAEWQFYLQQGAPGYPVREAIHGLARAHGARVPGDSLPIP